MFSHCVFTVNLNSNQSSRSVWLLLAVGVCPFIVVSLLPRQASPPASLSGKSHDSPHVASYSESSAQSASTSEAAFTEVGRFLPATPPENTGQALDTKSAHESGHILAIRAALEMTDPERAPALIEPLRAWVRENPQSALQWVATLSSPDREMLHSQIVQVWTEVDSTAALQWASLKADAAERAESVGAVCLQLAQKSPVQAIAAAERYGLADSGHGAMENLATQWAQQDLPAAKVWVDQQPQGELHDELVSRVAQIEAGAAPAAAARWMLGRLSPGAAQDEAALSILHQWGTKDLAAAARWVNQFPEGALRNRAEAELAGIANRNDALP
jgi:hypothetical protein